MSQHDHDHVTITIAVRRRTVRIAARAAGSPSPDGINRRDFLGGMGAMAALGRRRADGLSWSALAAAEPDVRRPRRAGRWSSSRSSSTTSTSRAKQTSWRAWGGIQTQQDADQEVVRIKGELDKLQARRADFPVQVPARGRGPQRRPNWPSTPTWPRPTCSWSTPPAAGLTGLRSSASTSSSSAAPLRARSTSGTRSSARATSASTPTSRRSRASTPQDVVVDNHDEILWRLRVAVRPGQHAGHRRSWPIGGPGGWAQPGRSSPTWSARSSSSTS